MFVQRGQRELGHQIDAVSDAQGVGNNVVVDVDEGRIVCAGAGVGVDRGAFEGRLGGIGSDVQGEECGQRAPRAVAAVITGVRIVRRIERYALTNFPPGESFRRR